MKKGIRKLVLSASALGFTAISLITSTFAFVNLNTEAKVAEFGFTIKNQEGLLISTDGINFSQDLNYTQITSAILNNYNKDLPDNEKLGITEYDKVRFLPVTLESDTDDKVKYSSYEYALGNSGTNQTDYKANFLKDSIVLADDAYKTAVGADDNDIYYRHELVSAKSNDYIFIDLWLTVANVGSDRNPYVLKMSDRTSIKGEDDTITLRNSLTTTGTLDTRSGVRASGPYKDIAYTAGEYLAEDTIKINAADAMRLAVVKPIEAPNTKPTIKVYEPSVGLGSYAFDPADIAANTELQGNDNYVATKNAAYTYYNSLNPLSPFTAYNGDYAKYFEGTKTLNTFTGENDNYGTFTYNSQTESYNVIKLSVMIWLEGWDADYLMGISAQDVSIKLGFKIDPQA